MRRKITAIMCLAFVVIAFAQISNKLTTNTILDLMPRQHSGVRKAPSVNGTKLSAFVKFNDASVIDSIKQLGVEVGTVAGNILTARIPVDAVDSVAALQGVDVIEAAQKVTLAMDSSRILTNVDKVQAGQAPLTMPFLGKGVVVADIDAGLDFGHPDFYTSDRKTLRLKRVWLQADTVGGTVPAKFGYGKEFTTPEAILKKGTDLSSYAHSSHVLGIAAGADTTNGNPYYGIAREADLVFTTFGSVDTGIADAMKYVFNYADSVGEPAVINMSLGTQMGPHDGTSLRDQIADQLAGPGHIFVGSAGNDGLVDAHVSKSFTADNDTLLIGIAFAESLNMAGSGEMQFWGDEGKSFKIKVCTIDKTTLQPVYQSRAFNASRSYSGSVVLQKPYDMASGSFDIVTQTSPLNNRPTAHITLNLSDYKPGKVIAIMVIGEPGTTVHGWANNNYCCFRKWNEKMDLPDNKYQTGEIGGVGKNVITVGAYVTRPFVRTVSGDTLNNGGSAGWTQGFPLHDIAPFSNQGPTLDGRMKPDISAPGSYIISALNSFSYSDASYVLMGKEKWNGRTYGYGAMQGTSMSAPQVAGIIATWLEANPTLTTEQIRETLKDTAIKDKYTGDVQNNTWGYGKIDAYAGLVYILKNFSSVEQVKKFSDTWKGTPMADGLHVLFLKDVDKTRVNVYTTSGALAKTLTLAGKTTGDDCVVSFDDLGKGVYVVHVSGGGKEQTFKYLNK